MHRRRPRPTGGLVAALTLAALSLVPATAQAVPSSPAGTAAVRAAGTPTDARPASRAAADGSTEDPIAHDPTLIRQGEYHYAIITGDAGAPDTYLPVKRSKDLVHWEELGPVFTTAPQWIVDTLGTTPDDFWAPEIAFVDGEYRLYYSASQFGTNNSVIALATTPTLDPDDPDHGWTDRGLVLRSEPERDIVNAIDPELVVDDDGGHWLAYGSFWSGIWIRPVDPATGKPVAGADPTHLLDRRWAPNAVEAPAIVRHGDFWYLFASFDYCCRGEDSEYRTVVGRSPRLTGPYVDREGQRLLEGGGTELLRGYNEFVGPGGGDVVVDGGTVRYVHHYYDADDRFLPRLSVREVTWDAEGWPSFGDPLTGSREVGHGPAPVSLVERSSGNVVGTVPGGPAAPLCGYEGADIALMAPLPNPCAAWTLIPAEDGSVGLRNVRTNKVAEVAGCAPHDGANVAQWGWLANPCQMFDIVPTTGGWVTLETRTRPSGAPARLLDGGQTCAVGDNVTVRAAQSGGCQTFRLQPLGAVLLVSDATGEAVARSGHATAKPRTTWRFTHTSEGHLRVTDDRGRALRVRGCEPAGDRAGAGVRPCTEWRLVAAGEGEWALADRATGRLLTLGRADRLTLAAPTGGDEQRFRLVLP